MRTTVLPLGLGLALACRAEPRGDGPAPDQPAARTPRAWDARADGVGPARAGMRIQELVQRLGGDLRREEGAGEGCAYAYIATAPSGVSFMLFGDTVVRVDVDTTGITTEDGLGVGSPEAALLQRHQGSVRVESHPYDGPEWHYLIVDPPADTVHRLIFETDGRRVTSFRTGYRHAVDLIEGCS